MKCNYHQGETACTVASPGSCLQGYPHGHKFNEPVSHAAGCDCRCPRLALTKTFFSNPNKSSPEWPRAEESYQAHNLINIEKYIQSFPVCSRNSFCCVLFLDTSSFPCSFFNALLHIGSSLAWPTWGMRTSSLSVNSPLKSKWCHSAKVLQRFLIPFDQGASVCIV